VTELSLFRAITNTLLLIQLEEDTYLQKQIRRGKEIKGGGKENGSIVWEVGCFRGVFKVNSRASTDLEPGVGEWGKPTDFWEVLSRGNQSYRGKGTRNTNCAIRGKTG